MLHRGFLLDLFYIPLIAYLAQQGFTAAEIGNMLFWVYLPWVFKFLWGPFVDNYHYLPMGRRRP